MSPIPKIVVIVYDAPTLETASGSGCGCGCGGHEHGHEHGHQHDHDNPLDRISIELQTQALGLTLGKSLSGTGDGGIYQCPERSPRSKTAANCAPVFSDLPPPLVYINGQGRFAGSLPVERIGMKSPNI